MALSALLLCLIGVAIGQVSAARAEETGHIVGTGSSFGGLAMQQWMADAQDAGLGVNYTPTGSPQGLASFAAGTADFAMTEIEYASMAPEERPTRGYEYAPVLASGIAVAVNLRTTGHQQVTELSLTPETLARIFMGDIASWADPAIKADNPGIALPDEPINVVYRGGRDGVTGQFFDFLAHTEPTLFATWAATNSFPTDRPIAQLDTSPTFAPKTMALQGADQAAQFLASGGGTWSITYIPYSYARTYSAMTASIVNASGHAATANAPHVTAALRDATRNADSTLDMTGAFESTDPVAYPIPLVSYLVLPCVGPSGPASCAPGPEPSSEVASTLTSWVSNVVCGGQRNMARIGYAPIPYSITEYSLEALAALSSSHLPGEMPYPTCPRGSYAGSCLDVTADVPLPFSDLSRELPACDAIFWAWVNQIVQGYPDGTFRPDGVVTRQTMVRLLATISGETPDLTDLPFGDVRPATTPFWREIAWASDLGVTTGYADGLFRPNAPVSRQALAAQLYRLAGSPDFDAPAAADYQDVPPSHPFYDEIEWTYANLGIAPYDDGGFHPNTPVTRADAVEMLLRFASR